MPKTQKHITIKIKGRCTCGYRTHSLAKLEEHVQSRKNRGENGHRIDHPPRKG